MQDSVEVSGRLHAAMKPQFTTNHKNQETSSEKRQQQSSMLSDERYEAARCLQRHKTVAVRPPPERCCLPGCSRCEGHECRVPRLWRVMFGSSLMS